MTDAEMQRGGVAVGQLRDLGAVEAGAVLYLRLWADGPDGRDSARSDFDLSLGRDSGRNTAAVLEQIFNLCSRYGRRPLIRHGLTCACVGADESCFANMIAAASDGAREDAMMMASLIVRADLAPCLVNLAESLGLALRRMSLDSHVAAEPQIPAAPAQGSQRLH